MYFELGGVLGGMGPEATVDFLSKVIRLTPAKTDQEHVPLIVHQVPQIPDRSAAILSGCDDPFGPMLKGLNTLKLAGATFAVIPCNSAHFWYARLVREARLDILHIGQAALTEIQQLHRNTQRPAIMATRGTIRARIYDDCLRPVYGACIVPGERTQGQIDSAIRATKSGNVAAAGLFAQSAAEELLNSGADLLVLACTELPIALSNSPFFGKCVDTNLALARHCVARALGGV